MDPTAPETPALRKQLSAALTRAMKARDQVAVTALRSTLGALANAEAVGVGTPVPGAGSTDVAGTTLGVGSTEAVRRALAGREAADLVLSEALEREDAARGYDAAGQPARADRLRAEATVIRSFLP
ncbi:MAG: Yqey-like protein [Marmoricola sp.]|nr:Yqey-like protein [Marmoricola sp.]